MSSNADRMRQVQAQLVREGAEPGMDFFVHHVTTADASSEIYGLKEVDGELEVYYRDLGHSRTLMRNSDAELVCARFRELVLELAAGRAGGRAPGGAT